MANLAQLVDQFTSFISGLRLVDGGQLKSLADSTLGGQGSITALAGGGLVAATPKLRLGINQVSVCVTNDDSVALPLAIPGSTVVLINDGAASCKAWPNAANPNNGGVADTIVPYSSVTPGTSADTATADSSIFWCGKTGVWKQALQA